MLAAIALTMIEASVLGVHLGAPRLAPDLTPERKRLLGLVLAPGLLGAVILRLVFTNPEDAAGASLQAGSVRALVVLVCLAALVAADLVALAGNATLERSGWYLLAIFALLGAYAAAWTGEALARGGSPPSPGVWIAAGARVLVMGAVGEAVLGLKPRVALAAGVLGLPLLWFGLPTLVQAHAHMAGAAPAVPAAAVLLVAAALLPAKFRRLTCLAGGLIACLALASIDQSWRSGRLLLEQQPMVESSE